MVADLFLFGNEKVIAGKTAMSGVKRHALQEGFAGKLFPERDLKATEDTFPAHVPRWQERQYALT